MYRGESASVLLVRQHRKHRNGINREGGRGAGLFELLGTLTFHRVTGPQTPLGLPEPPPSSPEQSRRREGRRHYR